MQWCYAPTYSTISYFGHDYSRFVEVALLCQRSREMVVTVRKWGWELNDLRWDTYTVRDLEEREREWERLRERKTDYNLSIYLAIYLSEYVCVCLFVLFTCVAASLCVFYSLSYSKVMNTRVMILSLIWFRTTRTLSYHILIKNK